MQHSLSLFILVALSPILPNARDRDGWSLRIVPRAMDTCLVGQHLGDTRFTVLLYNNSKETKRYVPIDLAARQGDFTVSIVQPDGKEFSRVGHIADGEFIAKSASLNPGNSTVIDFRYAQFGFTALRMPGRHHLSANLEIKGVKVSSPVSEFEVLDISQALLLGRHRIAPSAKEILSPKDTQISSEILEIQIQHRKSLIFRVYFESKTKYIYKIAELADKVVDMKIEGEYGSASPLTITYRETTFTKFTTKHVINSVDGRPWTAEEEKHRQEKLKREGK